VKAFIIIIIIIIILTAIGLMPGGSVTKIRRTYKKWTTSQCSTSASNRIQDTINRIQDTINRIQIEMSNL
jgi:hypothetical protein